MSLPEAGNQIQHAVAGFPGTHRDASFGATLMNTGFLQGKIGNLYRCHQDRVAATPLDQKAWVMFADDAWDDG